MKASAPSSSAVGCGWPLTLVDGMDMGIDDYTVDQMQEDLQAAGVAVPTAESELRAAFKTLHDFTVVLAKRPRRARTKQ